MSGDGSQAGIERYLNTIRMSRQKAKEELHFKDDSQLGVRPYSHGVNAINSLWNSLGKFMTDLSP